MSVPVHTRAFLEENCQSALKGVFVPSSLPPIIQTNSIEPKMQAKKMRKILVEPPNGPSLDSGVESAAALRKDFFEAFVVFTSKWSSSVESVVSSARSGGDVSVVGEGGASGSSFVVVLRFCVGRASVAMLLLALSLILFGRATELLFEVPSDMWQVGPRGLN